jgi:hypothetical protein
MIRLKHLISETVDMYGVNISTVPIDWNAKTNKEYKYAGQLRMQYKGITTYYKMLVKPKLVKQFPVLLKVIWKNSDGSFGIKTSEDQVWPVSDVEMATIVKKVKANATKITLQQTAAELTLTKNA